MKVVLVAVGRAGPLLAPSIQEYERRAARYWSLEVVEVKEAKARKGLTDEQIRSAATQRLLEHVPAGCAVVALTRDGKAWSSQQIATFLDNMAVQGQTGVAFLIGGALGLSKSLIYSAAHTLSLSPMTLTHELARLILVEQLYRAGTIVRGEPYHKARA